MPTVLTEDLKGAHEGNKVQMVEANELCDQSIRTAHSAHRIDPSDRAAGSPLIPQLRSEECIDSRTASDPHVQTPETGMAASPPGGGGIDSQARVRL